MATLRLIIALGLNRTTDNFGTLHFCKAYNKLVDQHHINECTLLNDRGKKVTEIVAPLQTVDCLWEIPSETFRAMCTQLAKLQKKISLLEG